MMDTAERTAPNERGRNALHIACNVGDFDTAAALIDGGFPTTAVDGFGRFPRDYAKRHPGFDWDELVGGAAAPVQAGAIARAASLIPSGGNIVAEERERRHLVFDALEQRDVARLRECIAHRACDLNARDANGMTALHWCAFVGWVDGARALIERRGVALGPRAAPPPDPSDPDSPGEGCGAGDTDTNTGSGPQTADDRALLPEARVRDPLFVDATYHEGHTPLMLACQAGNADVAMTLLDAGADPSLHCGAPGAEVWPVHLLLAAPPPQISDEDVVRVLAGIAEGGAEIGTSTGRGNTVLHIEARRGRAPVLEALLSHRSVYSLRRPRDAQGRAPADVAQEAGVTDDAFFTLLKRVE
jgi:ankyrin repeat protein